MTSRAWRRSAVVVLALSCIPASGRAEDAWYETYQGALKAIGSRKWAQAEEKLKAAMRTGPPPGRSVRTHGVRVMDYLPEYQLGLVYFNQQRYADALEQFAKVQASGLVTAGAPEFHPLTDMSEICRIRTGGASGAASARKEADALVHLARDLMGRQSPEEARSALQSAREKDPGHPGLADAFVALARLESEARARQEEARRAEAQKAAEAIRRTETDPVARITKAPPTPTPSARRAAPPESQGAFEAFYAGRYEAAGALFEQLAAGRPRDRARFLFYAACSHAALGLLRGDEGRPQLDRARRLYVEAGPSRASFAVADKLVSPRILETLASP